MKLTFKLQLLSLFLFVLVSNSYSQNNYASNISTTISDEQKLFISYDIVVNDGSKYFNVAIQISYEGRQIKPNPNNLYGDFGHGMTSGNKIIYWNYSEDFSGDITKVEVSIIASKENEPQAVFKSTSLNGKLYAPCEIKFNNTSTNSDRYEWNFADVNSGMENNSFEENPTHIFKKGGRYTITLTAVNSNLNLKHSFYETIVIKEYEPTLADFKIIGFDKVKKQSVPVIIEFKNLSKNADNYIWDFGDPNSGRKKNTSTESEPSHKYKNPGQYKIELTAISSFSESTDIKVMDLALPGKQAKEPKSTTTSDYEKHKKLKTIWLASTVATTGLGVILLLNSNSLKNDYDEATSNPEDIREKYETLDKIYPVAFGAAILSGVFTVIHAKKQKEAKTQISFQPLYDSNGGMVTLTYNF